MSDAFRAQRHQRTHCICGAARTAHEYGTMRCPEMYRPSSLDDAQRELVAAQGRGDEAAVFVARGDVQRLGGRP